MHSKSYTRFVYKYVGVLTERYTSFVYNRGIANLLYNHTGEYKMFVKCQSGKLVNLELVGEISIEVVNSWRGEKDQEHAVLAKTGAGADSYSVYVAMYKGTREECQSYIEKLALTLKMDFKLINV
jgi:hypothetical protein